jgi:hypothetical protein
VGLAVAAPPQGLVFAFLADARADGEQGPYEASLSGAAGPAGALLLDALRGDSTGDVRLAAALGLAKAAPAGASEALRAAALADDEFRVRVSCLQALETLRSADLPALARQLALQDESPEVQAASLQVLSRTSASDPATHRFLADCMAAGKPEEALPALAESGIRALAQSPSAELQNGLSALLLQRASDADLVDAFVDRAVEAGMAQFLPLFRALAGSLPADAPAREALSRGGRQLEEAPAYEALAAGIREAEERVRTLWSEFNRPESSPQERARVRGEISTLLFRIWERQQALRK